MKRAPKLWHEKFDITLTYASFIVKNEANKYVHYHYSVGEGVILCLHVDDIRSLELALTWLRS